MPMTAQVAPTAYQKETYTSLDRFISYYYQLELVRRTKPQSILFIGVGDRVVADLLARDPRYRVTTLDLDERLRPDVVGDVRALPFPDGAFDLLCVFEVLEHMPFAESVVALGELARVSRGTVALSVPHRRSGLAFALKLPFMRRVFGRSVLWCALLLPVRFPGFATSGQHYWEIDGWTLPLRAFRRALGAHFGIVADFTPPLDHYHHFFLLQSRRPSA